jgi:hypothetical protein
MAWGASVSAVGPVDDRCDFPGFDELREDDQVLVVLLGDEGRELLADEPGQQEGSELPIGASEPSAAGLASGDDERSLRGEARRRRDSDGFPPM